MKPICILYGDWSENAKQHMRFKNPTPMIGLKRTLAKHFKIYNVDEFRTSKMCCFCGNETEKFQWMDDIRPYKNGQKLVNGYDDTNFNDMCCCGNRYYVSTI